MFFRKKNHRAQQRPGLPTVQPCPGPQGWPVVPWRLPRPRADPSSLQPSPESHQVPHRSRPHLANWTSPLPERLLRAAVPRAAGWLGTVEGREGSGCRGAAQPAERHPGIPLSAHSRNGTFFAKVKICWTIQGEGLGVCAERGSLWGAAHRGAQLGPSPAWWHPPTPGRRFRSAGPAKPPRGFFPPDNLKLLHSSLLIWTEMAFSPNRSYMHLHLQTMSLNVLNAKKAHLFLITILYLWGVFLVMSYCDESHGAMPVTLGKQI